MLRYRVDFQSMEYHSDDEDEWYWRQARRDDVTMVSASQVVTSHHNKVGGLIPGGKKEMMARIEMRIADTRVLSITMTNNICWSSAALLLHAY